MAFAVFDPKPRGTPRIPRGRMMLGAGGLCNFPVLDLRAVSIADEATVLFDVETKQIALRPPRRGESPLRLTTVKNGLIRRVNLSAVFREMGVVPEPGRRSTTTEGGMIGFKVED